MRVDENILKLIPKIELHLHLDTSMSFDVVKKLSPDITKSEYKERFVAPKKCIDLADFLKCTSSGIELMQTDEQLQEVVKDLFVQLKRDNVIYAEIRFAPLLHTEKGLMPEEIVEIVANSVRESVGSTGIKMGVILCTLRHFNEAQSMQTVKLVEKYINNTPVAGFDIASDEAGHPIDANMIAFEYAIKKDIPRTAHAGEAKGPESVWETLQYFQPTRIGHGVRCIEDSKLVEYLAEQKIHLEICPTSNVQINVFGEYSDHPIDRLYKSGVSVGVNTDARALVNVSLTDEYVKLTDEFGWSIEDFRRCNLSALHCAFIGEGEKQELMRVLNAGFERFT